MVGNDLVLVGDPVVSRERNWLETISFFKDRAGLGIRKHMKRVVFCNSKGYEAIDGARFCLNPIC